jgi:hypothetical protein
MSNCQACNAVEPCRPCIDRAKRHLAHACDGPITAFVLISRASEGIRLPGNQGGTSPTVAANALYELLEECGFLVGEDRLLETGS